MAHHLFAMTGTLLTLLVLVLLLVVPTQVSPEFKSKVLAILTGGGFDDMRSSKMSQEEMLALLAAFNAEGIHFA
jgi:hypothetical protein